jgi:hypothetical protein
MYDKELRRLQVNELRKLLDLYDRAGRDLAKVIAMIDPDVAPPVEADGLRWLECQYTGEANLGCDVLVDVADPAAHEHETGHWPQVVIG